MSDSRADELFEQATKLLREAFNQRVRPRRAVVLVYICVGLTEHLREFGARR